MIRVIGLLLLLAAPLLAETCPVPEGASASLATVDSEARIKFLRAGMRRAAKQARVWAWSSAGVLAAVLQLQIMAAVNAPAKGDRIDLAVGAAASAFSIAQIAAVVPLVTLDQWKVDKLSRTSTDRCQVLSEAERLLKRDARSEQLGTGPGMHAASMLFNIGVGMVFGLGFNRWDSAAINVLLGAALSELQILTQPTDSVKLLDRYRAGDLTLKKGEKLPTAWHLVPVPTRDGAGLMVTLSF